MSGLSPAWAVQLGLYAALEAAEGLHALSPTGVGLYDQTPDEPVFPFLTIGEARCEPYDGVPGAYEHEVRLRAYSRHGGRRELKEIEGAVRAAVEALSVPGRRVAQARFVFADTFRQPDQDTFGSVLRFRIVTEEPT